MAIELNPDFACAWDNRGSARIKTGDLQGGFIDIEKSLELELDPKNAYAFGNQGKRESFGLILESQANKYRYTTS